MTKLADLNTSNKRIERAVSAISVAAILITTSAMVSADDGRISVVKVNENNLRPAAALSAPADRVVLEDMVLVPPPEAVHAGSSASSRMVASTKAFAPADQTAGSTVTGTPAMAGKTGNLFTMVRMLDYAPHPASEELLKKTPVELNGRKYWFNLAYDEDWKVVNDEEGYIQAISFEISVMENAEKVRFLKTPKIAINPKKIKKGQVLGIAEVAPYKFNITVDEFSKSKKGISELVFKLELNV